MWTVDSILFQRLRLSFHINNCPAFHSKPATCGCRTNWSSTQHFLGDGIKRQTGVLKGVIVELTDCFPMFD
jgi:hypothetical protein